MSDVYREQERRARKPHWCSECLVDIPKGATYIYASGVFDGSGWSAKFCRLCGEVRNLVFQYARYDADDCPCLGELGAWLSEELLPGVHLPPGCQREVIQAARLVLPDMLKRGKRLW